MMCVWGDDLLFPSHPIPSHHTASTGNQKLARVAVVVDEPNHLAELLYSTVVELPRVPTYLYLLMGCMYIRHMVASAHG